MKVVQLDGAITPVVLARSEVFPSYPEKSGVIRVDDYCQECAMQSDGKQGAKGKIFVIIFPNLQVIISLQLICITMTTQRV